MSKKKFFYGFIIVGACFIMMVEHAVVSNCYSYFIEPVTADLGFTKQAFSTSQSILFALTLVTALFQGFIYKKIKLMTTMRVASVTIVICYAALGFCSKLWQFYAISVILGICHSFCSSMPITVMIRNWFKTSYGLALGIALMGSGVCTMFAGPLIQLAIDTLGWRYAYFTGAGLMALLCWTSVFLLMKAEPADKGLRAYGESDEEIAKIKSGELPLPELSGNTVGQDMRSLRFWLLILFAALETVASYVICTFIPALYGSLGHSTAVATTCATVAMGCLAGGKIVLGRMFDKLGARVTAIISMAAMTIGMLGMAFSKNIWMFAVVAVGVFFGGPFSTVSTGVIVGNVFGSRDYAAKVGFFTAAANLGCALSPNLCGAVYDATGSYIPAMYILAAVCAVSLAVFAVMLPGRNEKHSKLSIPKEV